MAILHTLNYCENDEVSINPLVTQK